MSTPFTISGTLSLPPDDGLPVAAITKAQSLTFDKLQETVFSLTGTGTQDVDLGSIASPGCKAMLISVDTGSTVQPVLVKLNGASQGIELSAGGFMLFSNPNPAAGITTLALTYTSACKVRVWALG